MEKNLDCRIGATGTKDRVSRSIFDRAVEVTRKNCTRGIQAKAQVDVVRAYIRRAHRSLKQENEMDIEFAVIDPKQGDALGHDVTFLDVDLGHDSRDVDPDRDVLALGLDQARARNHARLVRACRRLAQGDAGWEGRDHGSHRRP